MSNLGLYQWMTATSKKVGGPAIFLFGVGATGAAIYKCGEIAIKKSVKFIEGKITSKPAEEAKEKLYSVTSPGKSNEGVEFAIGDCFRVLEADGDSVLVDKIGDTHNPYFVSAELLYTISDYIE